MTTKFYDLDKNDLKNNKKFLIQSKDEVLSEQCIDLIKEGHALKSPTQKINEKEIEIKLEPYLNQDLFGDISLIVIDLKNNKNLENIEKKLSLNLSENIFVIKLPKQTNKIMPHNQNSFFYIDGEVKNYEISKYIDFLINLNGISIDKSEVQSIETLSLNNFSYINNYLKLKAIQSNINIKHENHSILSPFDIINSLFDKSNKTFITSINRFFQAGNDPVQFNSLLFWFFKSTYRFKLNSGESLAKLRLFGAMASNSKTMVNKFSTNFFEQIIKKLSNIDKIHKGQGISLSSSEELKKILIHTHHKLHNG
jgi:DNA polymerase III delta subunit